MVPLSPNQAMYRNAAAREGWKGPRLSSVQNLKQEEVGRPGAHVWRPPLRPGGAACGAASSRPARAGVAWGDGLIESPPVRRAPSRAGGRAGGLRSVVRAGTDVRAGQQTRWTWGTSLRAIDRAGCRAEASRSGGGRGAA